MSSMKTSPKQLIFKMSPDRTSISTNPTSDLREAVAQGHILKMMI